MPKMRGRTDCVEFCPCRHCAAEGETVRQNGCERIIIAETVRQNGLRGVCYCCSFVV